MPPLARYALADGRLRSAFDSDEGRHACVRPRAPHVYGRRPRPASPSPAPPEGTFYLPGRITFGQIMTLVIGLLAAGQQARFDLDPPILEVQLQGTDGEPPLSHLAGEPVESPCRCISTLRGPPRLVDWSRCPVGVLRAMCERRAARLPRPGSARETIRSARAGRRAAISPRYR